MDAAKSFEQILAIGRVEQCGLIIACAPYLEDIGELGQESIGSNLDMLMSRARIPLLVVREPKSDPTSCFHDVLLPILPLDEKDAEAAGWGVRLVSEGGTIRLLLVADTDTLGRMGQLLGEYVDAHALDPDVLADLEARENAGLIAALQKHAAETGLGCKVTARTGDVVPAVIEVANAADRLVVVRCPRDRASAGYQRVQALVRESRNAVLIV